MSMVEPEKLLVDADQYIEQTLADWRAAGAAVTIIRGNEGVYARGFGVREVGKAARVDPDTLFQVGSTTKAFTAAALGLLVEEGRLRWDDPVSLHLPWFELADPWLTQQLTIRDTVTHRSGIHGEWYFVLSVMSSEEAVRSLRYARSEAAFRDSYVYSNLMYALAGRIIEAASGSRWGEFIEARLLKPLGMDRSGMSPYQFWDGRFIATAFFGSAPDGSFGIEQARDSNLAMPHGWDEKGAVTVLPWQSYDSAAAAGSLVSSAADMARWLILHLNEGSFAGRKILKPETVRELHALQNPRMEGDQFPLTPGGDSYAMGWFRGHYRGHLHLSHGGGMFGFPAYAAFIPERQIGVVVLANGPQPIRDELALNKSIGFWLLDRLLGGSQRDWSAEFLDRMRKVTAAAQADEEALRRSRISEALPLARLGAYTGTFEDRRGHSGPVSLVEKRGQLHLHFSGLGAFSACLEPWHRDLFRLHSHPEVDSVLDESGLDKRFVAFGLDPWGRVSSMRLFGSTFVRM